MNSLHSSAFPSQVTETADIDRVPAPAANAEALDRLDLAVEEARRSLIARQAEDGHWVYELEADATIPAEYILLEHFLGDIDEALHGRLAVYLRRVQGEDGGWPLFHAGESNVSASVKAYYALKLSGDSPDAPHMVRAREAILARGGAARSNVFTRISLALFEQVPWRAVPVMPVEIMLLPRWFPFHLSKISYWSRTVLVPLLVLMAHRPRARNPSGIDIGELFVTSAFRERHYLVNPTGSLLGNVFLALDKVLRAGQRLIPPTLRRRAIDRATAFVTERLNGEDGLGGIFPAMTNAVMVFHALGYSHADPDYVMARKAVRKLLTERGDDETYCQPCLSPVWDTALAMHALLEAGESADGPTLKRATAWLESCQITDVAGDWQSARPGLRPGGWAFEFENDYYPDTDDSAVVLMALERAGAARTDTAMRRGVEWIIGMQNRNGGWGSFDADNTNTSLNHIPLADHGALLDPPTADVSARCVGMLAQCDYGREHPTVARGIAYLLNEQEDDGSWYGRWGTNYIYGTWSVLSALNAVGEDPASAPIRRAVTWLKVHQRDDGGWGEDCDTYWPGNGKTVKASTPSQTAWALLGLMAAGEIDSDAVRHGVAYLLAAPRSDGHWDEKLYNAVGFPRVFFLKYHGYSAYFPLWALARYRNLRAANATSPPHGI